VPTLTLGLGLLSMLRANMSRRDTSDGTPRCLLNPDRAYSAVLRAYVQLPLLQRPNDGTSVAPLKSYRFCELRLVECVPVVFGQPPLRVELFDRRSQSVVESRACAEIEDAVAAFTAMIPVAEDYAAIHGH
jgi:hypothetical protein